MRCRSFLLFFLTLAISSTLLASRWGKNRIWNDGRAEVAVYDAERVVYGKARNFREQLIVVKEKFRTDTLVKADFPKKQPTFDVFKLNKAEQFETENYPYSLMTSVFVKVKNPNDVVKITVGTQEWCGNTFKVYKSKPGAPEGKLEWFSYFDGEADGAVSVTLEENDYFEDQLPLSLRTLDFKLGVEKAVRVWPSLSVNRAKVPQPEAAKLKIVGEEVIRSYAGSIPSWKVLIQKENGSDTYWFAKEYPHILTKMVKANGQKRTLHGRARWSYWDRRIPTPNVLK